MALGLALSLLGVVGLANAVAADWPSYRGGPTQNMSRPEDPGFHPKQIWEGLESMRSEPCVIASAGSLFTFATRKSDFGLQRLFRIDMATGEAAWFTEPFELPARAACPAADGARVYYPRGKTLIAASTGSGESVWTASLPGEAGKPVVNDGTVYVVAGNSLIALDAINGSVLWSASVPPGVRPPLVLAGVVVSLASESSQALKAFDAETGEFLWAQEGQIFDAIGVDSSVIFSLEGKAVRSRDAGTGELNWSYAVPPLTTAGKLVADEGIVYALTPSTDFRFQANHLIALSEKSGAVKYAREFEMTESCCGTTAAYAPFVKFGTRLYNHYRYFEAATGASPGTAFERTQTVFYSGSGCSNEQDGMFAQVEGTVYAWKNLCSRWVLVARQSNPILEGPGKIELIQPEPDAFTEECVQFGWRVESTSGLSHYELVINKEVAAQVPVGESKVFYFDCLPYGAHTWSVVAVSTGGTRTQSETRTFTIDFFPPAEFELLKPAGGAIVGSQPQFSWEQTTDVGAAGLDHYALYVDGAEFKVPAGTESFSLPYNLQDGGHDWRVEAIDRAGNIRKSTTRKFTVDGSGPQGIEPIEPLLGQVTVPRPQFRWYASFDTGTGVDRYELFVDESLLAKIPAEEEVEIFSFTPGEDLSEGKHSWSVRAYDSIGNFKQSETLSFMVDNSLPAPFSLLSPSDGAIHSPWPELDWEASTDTDSGLAHYELVLDGKPIVVEGDRYQIESDIGDGPHTWSVVAIDNAGNRTESETRTFTIDRSPPAPFALLEPENGAVTDARPRFAWEPAVDVGAAGLDRYELFIDERTIELAPGSESFVPLEDLAAGAHAWQVAAIDRVGNRHNVEAQGFIVASPPQAVLPDETALALNGMPVSFDASASVPPPAGEITGYHWDLDGDGTFELDTGTLPAASHVYPKVEDLTVSVKVVSNLGTEATDTQKVSVRPAPPAGPLGVTINNGAQFTNNPDVVVSVVWPDYAATASLANDGGFRTAAQLPLIAGIPWTLESSGSERLPKTVYVRFEGGSAGRETYQDDIILDQQKPKVGKATLAEGTALQLGAWDRTSGVTAMQLASGGSVGSWRPFERRVEFSHRHRKVKVRVRDRAGNTSLWRQAGAIQRRKR